MRWPCLAIALVLGSQACKTTEQRKFTSAPLRNNTGETPKSESSESAQEKPSSRTQLPGDLVSLPEEETLVPRDPNSRCPNEAELTEMIRLTEKLNPETSDLVKTDIAVIRELMQKPGRDTVNSCCNMLEQLATDATVMNEDKPEILDAIRGRALALCPPVPIDSSL